MPRNGGKTWRSLRDRVKRVVLRLEVFNSTIECVVGDVRGLLADHDQKASTRRTQIAKCKRSSNGRSDSVFIGEGALEKQEIEENIPMRHSIKGDVRSDVTVGCSLLHEPGVTIVHPRLRFLTRNEVYFKRKARCVSNKSLVTPTETTSNSMVQDEWSSVKDSPLHGKIDKSMIKHPKAFCSLSLHVPSQCDQNNCSQHEEGSCNRVDSDQVGVAFSSNEPTRDILHRKTKRAYEPTTERITVISKINDAYTKNDLILKYFKSLSRFEQLDIPDLEHEKIVSCDNDSTATEITTAIDNYTNVETVVLNKSGDFDASWEIGADTNCETYEARFEDLIEKASYTVDECDTSEDVADSKIAVSTSTNEIRDIHAPICTNRPAVTECYDTGIEKLDCDHKNSHVAYRTVRTRVNSVSRLSAQSRASSIDLHSDDQRQETGYNTQDTTPIDSQNRLDLRIEEVGHILTEWASKISDHDITATHPPRDSHQVHGLVEQLRVTI